MVTAYVLINCDMGSEESVINDLKSIIGVKNVNGIFGAYDIIAEVQTPTVDDLRETITMKIRKISGTRSTLTLMAMGDQ
jgi:DNA-binding Lrp family transcriptional regulator